jgi:thiamine-monophosphate kinase
MIDLSDGLHPDLSKLLEASGVGADVEIDRVPLSSALRSCFEANESLEFALNGGDDYELCFTVPLEREDELGGLIDHWPCPVTRIGQTTARPEIAWTRQGRPYAVPPGSFRHF